LSWKTPPAYFFVWGMRMPRYDVIIIGAGPAGIFAGLELIKHDHLRVLILEQGADISKRICLARDRDRQCAVCRPCAITGGWGGAGAFSDGKLTLTPDIGGWLGEYVDRDELNSLIAYVDGIYVEFGAPHEVFGIDENRIKDIKDRAVRAELTLVTGHIRHMGTDRCAEVLQNMYDFARDRLEVKTNTDVTRIEVEDGRVTGVLTADGERFSGNHVIVAPGRKGSGWLRSEAERLGLEQQNNAVDIGIRVEVPAAVTEELTDALYESKLIYTSRTFKDNVRTFCMNPRGVVSPELNGDVVLVNGHSYSEAKTDNTNFAVLVSTTFTEPFREPIAYGQHIARLANMLGGGILVQTLGDLRLGRRSTPSRIAESTVKPTMFGATPGDLSFVLPYRYLVDIKEMLAALDRLAPGVNSRNTLLYGVEVKFYSSRLRLSSDLETQVDNLYAVGDGAGVTRGLIQSSCSGVLAARSILEKARAA
jgi:uncharacterized FAD-dependent dehydrogenase